MHPRGTRNRPLRILRKRGYQFFSNNINSPGFLRRSMFNIDATTMNNSTSIWVDAVSCHILSKKSVNVVIGKRQKAFYCFLVQFWWEKESKTNPVLSVEVHAPSSWTPQIFLDVFEENLEKHGVISLINSYYIDREPLKYNTINTMHHKFMS